MPSTLYRCSSSAANVGHVLGYRRRAVGSGHRRPELAVSARRSSTASSASGRSSWRRPPACPATAACTTRPAPLDIRRPNHSEYGRRLPSGRFNSFTRARSRRPCSDWTHRRSSSSCRAHRTPVLDALFRARTQAGALGTMSWTVDVSNPNTGDDFVLGVKELNLPDGSRRPYSLWLAGEYPKVLDGLCKLLSLTCGWSTQLDRPEAEEAVELREQNGEFWAPVPGADRSALYPSTVAYIAALLLQPVQGAGHPGRRRAERSVQSASWRCLRRARRSSSERRPSRGKCAQAAARRP